MSTNLYQCHQQWASRPADQRFTSLIDLNNFCQHAKDHSASKTIASRDLSVAPIADDADRSPEYLARVRAAGYLSVPFADDIELSMRV